MTNCFDSRLGLTSKLSPGRIRTNFVVPLPFIAANRRTTPPGVPDRLVRSTWIPTFELMMEILAFWALVAVPETVSVSACVGVDFRITVPEVLWADARPTVNRTANAIDKSFFILIILNVSTILLNIFHISSFKACIQF